MSLSTPEQPRTTRREAPDEGSDRLQVVTTPSPGSVASEVAPLVHRLLGHDADVRVELWDGSAIGPRDPVGTLVVRSPDALSRILWAPGELGLGRAFVAGDLDVEGDIIEVLGALRDAAGDKLGTGVVT
ncbi:MAG TPA: hypothetical protein VIR58_15145, partial [Acidimicrobiales bacterium]